MIRRILNLLISFCYYFYKIIFTSSSNYPYTILYYHSVLDREKELFKKQLDFLKKHFDIYAINEHIKHDNLRPAISITFDDALLSVLHNAQPELISRRIPFTVFVPYNYIGKLPDWEVDSYADIISEPVMNKAQLNLLDKTFCIIGSHTLTHAKLGQIEFSNVEEELIFSKARLEELCGTKIDYISFPYGSYNDVVIELARKAGYQKVYTIDYRPVDNDEFTSGRIGVTPKDWKIELYLKIYGGYFWKTGKHKKIFNSFIGNFNTAETN